MAGFRQDKINDQVAKELTEILRQVKDPRVSKNFVSVTRAAVTNDLSLARIFYSVMGESDAKDVQKGLVAATGFIRSKLAETLNLRITPKLVFVRDDSGETAMRISQLLREIGETLNKEDEE